MAGGYPPDWSALRVAENRHRNGDPRGGALWLRSAVTVVARCGLVDRNGLSLYVPWDATPRCLSVYSAPVGGLRIRPPFRVDWCCGLVPPVAEGHLPFPPKCGARRGVRGLRWARFTVPAIS